MFNLTNKIKTSFEDVAKKNALSLYSFIYILGVCSLTLLVVLMKKLSKISGVNIFEILFIREAFIVFFMLPLMKKEKFNPFKADNFKTQLLRHFLFSFSAFFWYSGIFLAPVNEMIAMGFISQILASIFAAFILKEKVSKAIPFSIVMAFFGVFIMQAHKISFQHFFHNINAKGYLFCLIAILIRGYIPILNKELANTSKPSHINFMTHIVFLISCIVFCGTFKTFSFSFLPLFAVCGFLYFLENYLLIIANRHIPVYFLQLLDFSKIIFSVVFSSFFLGEGFTSNQIIGAFIIFASYFIATRYKINVKK